MKGCWRAVSVLVGSYEGLLEAKSVCFQAVMKGCWRHGARPSGSYEGLLEAVADKLWQL